MFAKHISINGRKIGSGAPVYIVAEMSGNHNGDFAKAARLVEAARDAGADAIKLQTYTPDTLTIKSDQPCFQISAGTLWEGRTLYDLYSEATTPWDWHAKLAELAHEAGLHWFSTPFDLTAVDFLEGMGTPAYKIASFEIVDLALIEAAARTGKPIIMSTGMASLEEIRDAVETARSAGAKEIVLLKCTSAYPAPPEDMNLRTIPHLANEFEVPVGLSDHTLGISIPAASVGLGVCVIEKHLTLSRADGGPDSAFSLEPEEFKSMVEAIRTVEKAMGEVRYGASNRESQSLVFRRSLFAVRHIKRGETLTADNVRSIRPGYGLPPKFLNHVLGRRAMADIQRGTPISWSLLDSARG